jgi:hypothetical protein
VDQRVPWDDRAHGAPINQLELLGTLWAFALTSLDALEASGMGVEADEAAAWLDLWNLVGHQLGIGSPEAAAASGHPDAARLLPMGLDEARACFEAIQACEFADSVEGRALVQRLLGVVEELMPGKKVDWMVAAFVRLYMTDRWADLLGVPDERPEQLFRKVRIVHSRADGMGGGLRRKARRRLNGVHRHLLVTLTRRIADKGASRSIRTSKANRRLVLRLRRFLVIDWRWRRRVPRPPG